MQGRFIGALLIFQDGKIDDTYNIPAAYLH